MRKLCISLIFLYTFGVMQAHALSLSCIDFKDNMKRGDESDDVLLLQNFFVHKKLLHVTPNGYFGPATFAATRMYQKSKGLSRSGAVFPLTRSAIKEETCIAKDMEHSDAKSSDDSNHIVDTVSTSSLEALHTSSSSIAEIFSREVALKNIDLSMEKNQKAISLSNARSSSFPVNANYIKLGTVALITKTTIHVVSLSFSHSSTSGTSTVLSNFTITDVGTGKITNTWPLFAFTNVILPENNVKMYELYANSADLPQGVSTKDTTFSGHFVVKEDNATTTSNVEFPSFTVSVSK